MTELLGVDVSHFQGAIDWPAVARSGVQFAMIKATEGTGFTDPRYVINREGARGSGLIVGAYHFLTRGSPLSQCDHFLATVGTFPQILALDVEASDVGASDLDAWINHFAKVMPGDHLLVYSNAGLWHAGTVPSVPGTAIQGWHAGYRDGAYTSVHGPLADEWAATRAGVRPSSFGGITSYPMIQFTDHAIVPGIASPCDGNAWLGTRAELESFALIGADMPLTTADADLVADRLLRTLLQTKVPESVVNISDADTVASSMAQVSVTVRALSAALIALAARLDAIEHKLDQLATAGVDPTVLARALADLVPVELGLTLRTR